MKIYVTLLLIIISTNFFCLNGLSSKSKADKQSIIEQKEVHSKNSIITSKYKIISEDRPIIVENLNAEKINKNFNESDSSIFNFNFKNKLKKAEFDLMNKLKLEKNELRRTSNFLNQTQESKNLTNLNKTESVDRNEHDEMNQSKDLIQNLKMKSGIIPTYQIKNLYTRITINSDKTYGEVYEKVEFELSDGTFSSIIRKISLGGSSDSLVAFKLSSNSVKLKEVRIITNCFEDNTMESSGGSDLFEQYLCVIAIFEEINAKEKHINVVLEYEYVAQSIVRINDNKNALNTIIWYYDNNRRMQSIENIHFNLQLVDNKNMMTTIKESQFIVYPNKFTIHKQQNITELNLDIRSLKENENQKISIEIPSFNRNCRKLYDLKMEVTSYSTLQLSLWILIAAIFIFMVSYIYINEKEKNDSLKLSEEYEVLKTFQEKEKIRNQRKNATMRKSSNNLDNN